MKKIIALCLVAYLITVAIPLALSATERNPVMKHAIALAKEGKYDEAIATIKKVIESDPSASTLEAHLSLGLIYYKAKQYDNSFNEFTKASEEKNDSSMAFYFLGMVTEKMALGRGEQEEITLKKKALESWKRYLEISAMNTNNPSTSSYKHTSLSKEECLKRAKKHIMVLQEELNNENK